VLSLVMYSEKLLARSFNFVGEVVDGASGVKINVILDALFAVVGRVGAGEPSRGAYINFVKSKSVLLHEHGVFSQQIPDKLFECIESFDRTDFDYKEDVALMLIADGGVELGVEGGFVLREVVQVNDSTMDIAKFDMANAVDKAAKHRMEDFGSLGDRIGIVERKVKSNLGGIEHHILLGGVDIHSLGESSGRFCHGQLFQRRFCTRTCVAKF
jgi:hypothetical protein